MANRILSKSNQQLDFEDIADTLNYRKRSLQLFFSEKNENFIDAFVGLTIDEILLELQYQISEAEKDACLNLLAAIEAKFRLDYALRCQQKDKFPISRKFRVIFTEYEYRIPLEDILFEEWKESGLIKQLVISELKGAFKPRLCIRLCNEGEKGKKAGSARTFFTAGVAALH